MLPSGTHTERKGQRRPLACCSLSVGTVFVLLELGATNAGAAKIKSFDPPNSIETVAVDVNSAGWIVGYYGVSQGSFHGFVRSSKGTITTFDPAASRGTHPSGINDSGIITGRFEDKSYVSHGFLRSSQGTFAAFDPTGSTGTFPNSINDNGSIAGNYLDSDYRSHGFVRPANGTIESFDPTDSTGTYVYSINADGYASGSYLDSNFATHGFVRDPDGSITTYDPPGDSRGVGPTAINSRNSVAGTWFSYSNTPGVFEMNSSGEITGLDVVNACGSNLQSPCPAYANDINVDDVLAGSYVDNSSVYHGYEYSVDKTTSFDPSGSTGTYAMAINGKGVITGYYADEKYTLHGFIRKP
jgi:hypothetical protein